MKKKYLFLKTVASDGKSYGGFKWPLKAGAKITAKDWNPEPVCGGGFHGLLNGEGDGSLLCWDKDARWIVFSSDSYVDLDRKAKVKTATVRHVGDRLSATEYLKKHSDGKAIVGASCTAGDYGTATAGHSGTATAGHRGTATAGYNGTATAGDRGTATAGYSGTATAGNDGTATAGHSGTATAGHRGTATAGYNGTATAGDSGTATAGDYGTATAGYNGTATAGNHGTATAGDSGTATAGNGGIIQIAFYNGRNRILTGYIGETTDVENNKLEPNVSYKVIQGSFIRS